MQHCLQFIRALHTVFPLMVRYWLTTTLKQCQLSDLDEIIKILVTSPVRIVVDSSHIFVFATHWAKIPLRSFSSRGRDAIHRMLIDVPMPFKMKLNSFYKPNYTNFKYNSYVDARFRRDALVMAFVGDILSMFTLPREKEMCKAIIGQEVLRCAAKNLPATHPLYRQLNKKIYTFCHENKK